MVTGSFTHRYRANPRLSANQLGDYLTASASGRRRIIQDAKFPPTMVVVLYEDARRALRSHLQAGSFATDTLEKAVSTLGRKLENAGLTKWKKRNHRLCIEAIEAFQASEEKIGLGGIKYTAPDSSTSKIGISGVSISVSLDLIAHRTDAKGVKSTGGVVLVFSKTGGPDKNAASRCEAIAFLIHELVASNIKAGVTCDPALCMAVDVFSGKVYRAKTRRKKLLNLVESSCDEVAAVWPKVKPPKGYYGPPILAA